MTRRNKPQALYLHVPFCASVCSYCDFARTVYTRDNTDAWLGAAETELHQKEINPDLKTIYLGGGTPVCLSEEQLERLLTLMDPYRSSVKEYTCEINPEVMTETKVKLLKDHCVNRVSIGFQTHDPALLKKLGRRHSAEDVFETVKLFRKYGIDNISLDLMYSLPGQTMDSLQQSVETAVRMDVTHLSLYSLTIEENSVFGKTGVSNLDEETEADMYEWICQTLPQYGYEQYEISNFAKDGKQSMHNRVYWEYEDFYGISCGASGKEGNVRYDKPRRLKDYLNDPMQREETVLSTEDERFEAVMMNLRLKEGMSRSRFEKRFGLSFEEAFRNKYEPLAAKGWLEIRDDLIRCTPKGYEVLNSVLSELL